MRAGRVVATDLSGANIRYAKQTVRKRNVEFYQCDVTQQFGRLNRSAPDGYDVVVLIDVIEHIPEKERPSLFENLAKIAKPNGLLAMTYPSPEYQRYLEANRPKELQIVDNVIELPELLREAGTAGWHLQSFARVDVWLAGQYVHCLLTRSVELSPIDSNARHAYPIRVIAKVSEAIRRRYRRWYYCDRLGLKSVADRN